MISCPMEGTRGWAPTAGSNELALCLDILPMPKPGKMSSWLLLSAVEGSRCAGGWLFLVPPPTAVLVPIYPSSSAILCPGTPISETHPAHQSHPVAAAIRPSSPGLPCSAWPVLRSCSAMGVLLGLWASLLPWKAPAIPWVTLHEVPSSRKVIMWHYPGWQQLLAAIIIPDISTLACCINTLPCMLRAELSLPCPAPLVWCWPMWKTAEELLWVTVLWQEQTPLPRAYHFLCCEWDICSIVAVLLCQLSQV